MVLATCVQAGQALHVYCTHPLCTGAIADFRQVTDDKCSAQDLESLSCDVHRAGLGSQ